MVSNVAISYAASVFLTGPRTLEKRLLIFKTWCKYANMHLSGSVP